MFFAPSAMPCRAKKSTKMLPRAFQKHLSNQHPNLHRFWNQLGSILGGFWEPSWSQVGTKWLQKSIPKTMKKSSPSGSLLGAIFWNFRPQHASQEGGPEIDFRRFFASWGHLGAKMAPRPPQTPPRGLLGAILNHFGFHFVRFLNGFVSQLGRFLDGLAIALRCIRRHSGGMAEGSWILYVY